jgi:hypothetical protein
MIDPLDSHPGQLILECRSIYDQLFDDIISSHTLRFPEPFGTIIEVNTSVASNVLGSASILLFDCVAC